MLQMLWGMINCLQIINAMALFALIMPAHTERVLFEIMRLINLDALEIDPFVEQLFSFKSTKPLGLKFEKGGYDRTNFVVLAAPPLLTLFVYSVLHPFRLCLQCLSSRTGSNFCTKKLQNVTPYRNFFYRYIIEGCIDLGICALITLTVMSNESWATKPEAFSNAVCFIIIIALVMTPLALFNIVTRLRSNPEDEEL
jgi:hypothetical protein